MYTCTCPALLTDSNEVRTLSENCLQYVQIISILFLLIGTFSVCRNWLTCFSGSVLLLYIILIIVMITPCLWALIRHYFGWKKAQLFFFVPANGNKKISYLIYTLSLAEHTAFLHSYTVKPAVLLFWFLTLCYCSAILSHIIIYIPSVF